MSTDNGIYIHKFKEGYRVTHGQAVENISIDPDSSGYNTKELKKYFRGSMLFKTSAQAWKYARGLYKQIMDDYGIIEYGICEV